MLNKEFGMIGGHSRAWKTLEEMWHRQPNLFLRWPFEQIGKKFIPRAINARFEYETRCR